jgi:hypothetical protein
MTNVLTTPNLKEGTTYHMGKNDKDEVETNNDNENLSVKEHSHVSLRNWIFLDTMCPNQR